MVSMIEKFYSRAHVTRTGKTFQALNIYLKKAKKPSDGFFSHILFASAIILIFGGISFT